MLKAGDTFLAIAWWNQGKEPGNQPPITVDHFGFRVDKTSFEKARAELPAKGVKIEYESDHGNCRGLYFRDPDNHMVELICYEITGAPDKMPVIY